MNIGETIRQSIDSLLRNRLRSGLTMLGIAWGLVTVVLLLSYGKSLGQEVMNGFLGLRVRHRPACSSGRPIP